MKILITLFLLIVLTLSFSLEIDKVAFEMQDEAFDRALVSFGLAKGLNAVISLLQGTELSFTPVGVGLNFSIGEVLDPFNDMVERFSWVMLTATVSLGIQKIILTLSSTLFMQVTLSVSIVSSLFLVWSKKIQVNFVSSLVVKSFVFLIFLRFSAILFISVSSLMHTEILSSEYREASVIIEKTKQELDNLNKKNQTLATKDKNGSLFSRFSSKYDQLLEKLNVSKQLENLQESIENASKNIIKLITIFIVETLLLPLLYFWLLIISIKYIFRVDANAYFEKLLYNKEKLDKG